jgi:predicted transcriptional regulator
MYQDEQIQNVAKMEEKALRMGSQAFRTGRDLANMLNKNKKSTPAVNPFNKNQPFVFSGQYTDLCYFLKNPHMAFSEISDIENTDLREAVMGNFNMAQKEGLIDIDRENGIISLTEKGERYISNPNFQRVAKNDQSRAMAEMRERMANERNSEAILPTEEVINFELTGEVSDLSYFEHTDKLNLFNLKATHNTPDDPLTPITEKVADNFYNLEEAGFVEIDSKMNVTLTEKGKSLLESDDGIKNIAQGAINNNQIPKGKVAKLPIDITKPLDKKSAMKLLEKGVSALGPKGVAVVKAKQAVEATVKVADTVNQTVIKNKR